MIYVFDVGEDDRSSVRVVYAEESFLRWLKEQFYQRYSLRYPALVMMSPSAHVFSPHKAISHHRFEKEFSCKDKGGMTFDEWSKKRAENGA